MISRSCFLIVPADKFISLANWGFWRSGSLVGSIWLVRIPVAAIFAPVMGLKGVWIAMCIELTFRGGIFLWRMAGGYWYRKARKGFATQSEVDAAQPEQDLE